MAAAAYPSHFSAVPSLPSTPSVASLTSPRVSIDRPDASMVDSSDAKTPTNPDFAGISGQRPLPNPPFSPANVVSTPDTERSDTDRDDSKEHQDVEMGEDGDQDESDNDNASLASDLQRNKKKKKGQRFFCTDYPPCMLSFTRSEHLARHVRKHTGERPFQCHCGRRFSRLDNLRQHAQTVHVNEEIPGDSLAATGTRFQRQIRTDRVRAPAGRARAGSGSHVRGHSRNLSASSVVSNTSNISALPEDARRHPQPLAMSHDPSRRIPETYPMGAPMYYHAAQQSPTAFSPPSSAAFPHAPSSPGYSPTQAQAYYSGAPNPRRLSVPAPVASYQVYPGHPAAHYPTASVSSIASSRASVYAHSRRESDAAVSDWRRRTWHPSTYQRPATSGLVYQQTPDDARPTTATQPAASQVTRLPGIESFDHAVAAAPAANRNTSPMRIDESGRPVYEGPSESRAPGPDDRRSNSVWEASLHQNLNRLDLTSRTPPRQATHSRPALPAFSFPQGPVEPAPRANPRPLSVGDVANRRQGWYGGPLSRTQPISILDRASPVDSISSDGVPTPSTSHGKEAHPAILRHSAMLDSHAEEPRAMHALEGEKSGPPRSDSASQLYDNERQAYQFHSSYEPRRYPAPASQPSSNMGRLEALVAVATSESAQR